MIIAGFDPPARGAGLCALVAVRMSGDGFQVLDASGPTSLAPLDVSKLVMSFASANEATGLAMLSSLGADDMIRSLLRQRGCDLPLRFVRRAIPAQQRRDELSAYSESGRLGLCVGAQAIIGRYPRDYDDAIFAAIKALSYDPSPRMVMF